MQRRVVRVRISKALFSDILKCRELRSGDKIKSNLPDDAEVLFVAEDGDHLDTFSCILGSDLFAEVAPDAAIPEFRVVFERTQAVPS